VHGPVRQRIVNLIASRPDGISRSGLIALVYANDPNGGPTSENVVSVLVKKTNEELASQGFCIVFNGGPGSRYHLRRRS
jgi:hypothetical protein